MAPNLDDPSAVPGQAQLQQRWFWGLVLLGLAARLFRYARHLPLWEDECFIVSNLIKRTYGQLLLPLDFHQSAPVPYLWVQKALVDTLGFNEWSLRVVALFASVACLFLFVRVSGRLLSGWSRVLAVGFYAGAYSGVRYAAEAKPYALDALTTLIILELFLAWRQTADRSRMWLLAIAAPVCVLFSMPSLFMLAAISILALPALRRQQRATVAGWATLQVTTIAAALFSALVLYAGQRESALTRMQDYWASAFPPLSRPLELARWILQMLTGSYFAVPFGGENFGSTATTLLVACGCYALARQRAWLTLLLLLLPAGANFIAAAMKLYPMGNHMRLDMHAVALISIVAGVGAEQAIRGCVLRPRWLRPTLTAALLLLAACSAGIVIWDLVRPYKALSDQRARDWARSFWTMPPSRGQPICLKADLGLDFSYETFHELSWSTQYLVNAHIYSPRLNRNLPPDWQAVTQERPLIVAEYRDGRKPYDHQAQQERLAQMTRKWRLTGESEVSMSRRSRFEEKVLSADVVHLYTFVPLAGDVIATQP